VNIQGTFREHSGNIQHSGNMQGTCREHARNIQGTCREHSGNIQGTYGYIHYPTVCVSCARGNEDAGSVLLHFQETFDIQGTCREHSGNIH
jgi:hypothetical protein